MPGQLAQCGAVVELPGAGQAKDVIPALLLDQLEGSLGGKDGIGLDHHWGGPGRWHQLVEHLAEKNILMTSYLGIDYSGGDREAAAPPLGDEQDQRLTEQVRPLLVEACLARQRLLLAGLG